MSKSLIQLPNDQHVYVAWSEEATRIMYDRAASAQAVLEAYGSGKVCGVVESAMPAPPEHTCTPTDNDLCPACEFNKNEARKQTIEETRLAEQQKHFFRLTP